MPGNGEITSLNLKIQNDTSDAVKSVERLIGKVNELKASVSKGVDTKAFKDIKKAAESVSVATSGVSGGADKLSSAATKSNSAISKLGSAFKSIGGTVAKGITTPFTKAYQSITRFFSSIGRIAMYRLIRGAIKRLTQGFSEGVKNLYAWSEAFNTKFAPTMDMLKTQMTYLKNGFASMFSPLIEWVVPNVIVPLTDALVELFNYIQQGFAILVGHDYWYKAQKSMQKFGEATGKANIQLAKFDEINNLTETGSGSSEDASGMFTLEKVATGAKFSFFEALREAIKGGDWESIGRIIANGINKAWDSVDPSSIAEGFSRVINDAFSGLYGFASTLNFEKIGKDIGKFIDKVLKKVDWKKMGSSIGLFGGGIVKLILNAITSIQPENVFAALYDFLDGLFTGVGEALFEDNGYLAKKMGLQIVKTVLLAVAYAVDSLSHLGDMGIFLSPGETYIMKSIGLDQEGLRKFNNTTRTLAMDGLVAPINNALAQLDKNHDKWLADRNKANAEAAVKSQTTVQGTASWMSNQLTGTFTTIANHATQRFGSITTAANGVFNNADTNGITAKGKTLFGEKFVGGVVTGISNGKGSVSTAISGLSSGASSAGSSGGTAWANSFINSASAVIGSFGVTSSSSSGGTTHFHMIKDAMGGFMQFANGGFTSMLSQGTMYVAGEVPGQAEMVGNINGRTGVASGFEITGIRDAVLNTGEAEVQLLNRLLTALERKQLTISPSAQLGRVVAQSNRMYGAVTG